MNRTMSKLLIAVFCCIVAVGQCASMKPIVIKKSIDIEVSPDKSGKTPGKATAVKKGEELDLYYKGAYVGSMRWSDYQLLQEAAQKYLNELTAEQKKRVKIELADTPWRIEIGQKYITDAFIVWTDENDKEIKKIKLQITLERKDNNTFTCEQIKIMAGVFGGVAGAAILGLVIALIILL